jgi:hypothetical protein
VIHSIVAVHGLASKGETTWTHPETKSMWLKDFLHLDIPQARIMRYSHNSRWKYDAAIKDLRGYGKQLLKAVSDVRDSEEVR